ncbi:hypothetical protein [Streptomyces zagrosensis]|uniref:LPXTG cell wall anchor domain-containing protein n=1 Tax=Streptomyces zagrosensis TaxID=1042984 RepID=A0A7W9V2D1_9ACTN|nr:hypothetical protein [Streptomyces zagrosensis]MBB5939181.1 hypothetical protein [Streptomyces zagrosensis]
MTAARRPLLTAAAAGALLCALWFVPSAKATEGSHETQQSSSQSASGAGLDKPSHGLHLAESGSMDTTPYLVGGAGFLGLGATMVTISVRRSRTV